jgi:predicted amidophosphoribosyltransferase
MDEITRGSLLLPVLALIVGFFVLFGWLLSIEFRLYRMTRSRCAACGGEVSRTARRCAHCGEPVQGNSEQDER